MFAVKYFNLKNHTRIIMDKSFIGKFGEDLACQYLKNKGYTIIERNFRKKWGELDIIAKNRGVLVFVEVKTMRQSGNENSAKELNPENQLTVAKYKKLKRAASLYAGRNQNLVDDKKGWRIDLIAIDLMENQNPRIRHYENI